jgi:hypothetical protein
MFLSGAIGVLFQFVFRTKNNDWDTGRYIETVFIGLSRLANSTYRFECSFRIWTLFADNYRIVSVRNQNNGNRCRGGDVKSRQYGLTFRRHTGGQI